MNISIFIHSYPPAKGGLEYLSEKTKAILDKNNTVNVFCGKGLNLDSYKTFNDFINSSDKNIFRLNLHRNLQKLSNVFLKAIVLKIGIFQPWFFGPILKYHDSHIKAIIRSDILIAFGMPTKSIYDAYTFAKKYKKRLIIFPAFHDVSYYKNCSFFQKAFDYAEKVICLSSQEKNKLQKNYMIADNKLKIVSFSPFTADEIANKSQQLKKNTVTSSSTFTLGYVGQISTRKNLLLISNLLDKYDTKLLSLYPNFKFLLTGAKTSSSCHIEKIFKKHIKSNIVTIEYDFNSRKDAYSKFDIFVNPSLEESLGISNFEALYYGKMILTHSNSVFSSFSSILESTSFANADELFNKIKLINQNGSFPRDIYKKQFSILEKFSYSLYSTQVNDIIS